MDFNSLKEKYKAIDYKEFISSNVKNMEDTIERVGSTEKMNFFLNFGISFFITLIIIYHLNLDFFKVMDWSVVFIIYGITFIGSLFIPFL